MNKISLIAFGFLMASCGPAKMIPTPDVISEVQEKKSNEVIAFAQEANVSKTLKYCLLVKFSSFLIIFFY